jgi:hypothetical protein
MVDEAQSAGGVYRAIHGRRSVVPFTRELPGNDSPDGKEPTRAIPGEAQDPRRVTLVGARGRIIGPCAKIPPQGFDPAQTLS